MNWTFGCYELYIFCDLNYIVLLFDVGLGWVTSDYISRGLGWVGSVKSWVGLGYRKWTHVHVCTLVVVDTQPSPFQCGNVKESRREWGTEGRGGEGLFKRALTPLQCRPYHINKNDSRRGCEHERMIIDHCLLTYHHVPTLCRSQNDVRIEMWNVITHLATGGIISVEVETTNKRAELPLVQRWRYNKSLQDLVHWKLEQSSILWYTGRVLQTLIHWKSFSRLWYTERASLDSGRLEELYCSSHVTGDIHGEALLPDPLALNGITLLVYLLFTWKFQTM